MKIQPLNRKEAGKILEQIEKEYGCNPKSLLIDRYTFFQSDKNKIYIVNNLIKEFDFSQMRINSFGLYLCEINRGNIRLSIEGSQLLGKHCKKNILEIDEEISKQWMMGNDIPSEKEFNGFVIIKNNNDYMGSGKYKEGVILNFVSKQRRIKE
ncbi:MAG: methyltransferase RsmF C-terminal domain-like protein [Candidatus Woesearchaeota archaeon]